MKMNVKVSRRGVKIILLLIIILILCSIRLTIENQKFEYEVKRLAVYYENYLSNIDELLKGNEVGYEDMHRSKMKVVRQLERLNNNIGRWFLVLKKIDAEENRKAVDALWDDVVNKYYLSHKHREISEEVIELQVATIKNERERHF